MPATLLSTRRLLGVLLSTVVAFTGGWIRAHGGPRRLAHSVLSKALALKLARVSACVHRRVGPARFERRPTIWKRRKIMVGWRDDAPLVPPYILPSLKGAGPGSLQPMLAAINGPSYHPVPCLGVERNSMDCEWFAGVLLLIPTVADELRPELGRLCLRAK